MNIPNVSTQDALESDLRAWMQNKEEDNTTINVNGKLIEFAIHDDNYSLEYITNDADSENNRVYTVDTFDTFDELYKFPFEI